MTLNCQLETKDFYTIVFSIDCYDYTYQKIDISVSFNFRDCFYEHINDETATFSLLCEEAQCQIESSISKKIEDSNLQLERYDLDGSVELKQCIEEIKAYSRTVISSLWNKEKSLKNHTFMTGEPLMLSFSEETFPKYYSGVTQKSKYDYNLMLEKYPTFWNSECQEVCPPGFVNYFVNTNYAFFIAEISKAHDEYWEFAITLTCIDHYNERYFLGGRFKFIVKENDRLNFIYYKNDTEEEFKVTALITEISRNQIKLRFLQDIKNPFIQNMQDFVWRLDTGWRKKR